jgi:hypothetical protein
MLLHHNSRSFFCAFSTTDFAYVKHKVASGQKYRQYLKLIYFLKIKNKANIFEILKAQSCIFLKLLMEWFLHMTVEDCGFY